MAKFGRASSERRKTLAEPLQRIVDRAIKIYDFTIVCGYRDEEDQNIAFREGASKKRWPDSKHNHLPSTAMDICTWDFENHRIDWDNVHAAYFLAGIIIAIAADEGINIRWGGDWDSDLDLDDQDFYDLVHFELADG